MGGGNQLHSRISINVCALLAGHLESSPEHRCQAFNADMKIRLANEQDHVYADASVSCDDRDLADDTADYIRFPRLVVEVLSPSTQSYDRRAKFALYRRRDALREYVLVSTTRQAVEVRSRGEDDAWTVMTYGPGDDVRPASIDLTIPIAAFYRGIVL